ncbi:hypothetical protein MD484_g7230, partial [Candolleomyces efflorescens]
MIRKGLKKLGWKSKLRSDNPPQLKGEGSKTGQSTGKLDNAPHIQTAVVDVDVDARAQDNDQQVLSSLAALKVTDSDVQESTGTSQELAAPPLTVAPEASPALDLNLPSHRATGEHREISLARHAAPSGTEHDNLDFGSAAAHDTAILNDRPAVPSTAATSGQTQASQRPTSTPAYAQKKSKLETAYTIASQTIYTLNRCADAFPPLKVTTSILEELFKRYDQVKAVRNQLDELKDRVDRFVVEIQKHSTGRDGEKLKERIEYLNREFELSKARLESKVGNHRVSRYLNPQEDTDAIGEELRKMTCVLDVFMMGTGIETCAKVSKLEAHRLLNTLGMPSGAEYNHDDRPCCLDGTRFDLLAELLAWATSPEDKTVFWIGGGFGTGKTTVAETFCRILANKGLLGGSFFCTAKSPERRDVRSIFPFLARCLTRYHKGYRNALLEHLDLLDEDDIRGMNLEAQFEALFVAPVKNLSAEEQQTLSTLTFVVDALDECADNEAMEHFLEIILDNLGSHKCPFKFCVTGRPEPHIQARLTESGLVPTIQLDEIDDGLVEDDIYLYLCIMLGRIKGLKASYPSWPPPEIRTLASRTGRLFIWASTFIRYVKGSHADPKSRLIKVLENEAAENDDFRKKLHSMYALIFSEAFAALDDDEQDLSRSKLHDTSVAQIRNAFENLHSVVKVLSPLLADSDDDVITVHHYSVTEYLTTGSLGSKWGCSVLAGHLHLAQSCALVFQNHLHFGVSGIRNSDKNLNELPRSIEAIPSYLFYASFYWPQHWVAVFTDEATPSISTTSSSNDGEDYLIEMCTNFLEICIMLQEV